MPFIKRCGCVALACSALLALAYGGEIVDRIVANVNGHILLQSDWEGQVAFEALANARSLDSFTAAERKSALDRLIDQELLREQLHPSEGAPPGLVKARVAEIRKLHPAASEAQWQSILQRYGLTQAELEQRLSNDIELMRLVEAHLRPSAQVDTQAVESYYREHLLPELQKSGGTEVPLPQVSGHIKDLLTEQKMNQLLDSWLASLRSRSRIQTRESGGTERAQ